MADYSNVCSKIIDAVGGKDNITSVTHCATRLRLVLVDKTKYDAKTIDAIDEVQGLFFNSGQLQIIFGLNVPEVWQTFVDVCKKEGKDFTNSKQELKPKKKNPIMAVFKVFPPIIMPILTLMVGCALISATLAIIQTALQYSMGYDYIKNVLNPNPWYKLFTGVGGIVTNFLVLFVCLSAAKLWKVNTFIAAAVGVFLVAGPSLGVLIPGWASYIKTGITSGKEDLANGTLPYVASIFTGIAAIKFCSIIEHWLDKRISDNFKMFVVGAVSVTLTVLFSLLLFGPIMTTIEGWLKTASNVLTDPKYYGLGMALLGFLYAPLVVTGVHQVFIPVIYASLGTDGFDYFTMFIIASNIAQGMATICVGINTKEKKLKSLAYSSGAIALIGITEPAMFGVNLRNKKAFISAMVGSAIGSWFFAYFPVLFGDPAVAQIGYAGATGLPNILFAVPQGTDLAKATFTYMNIVWMGVGMVVTMAVTAAIALPWLYKKSSNKETIFTKKIAILKTQLNVMHTNFVNSKFMHEYENIKRKTTFLYDKKAKMEYEYPNLEKLNKVESPVEGKYIKLKDVNDPIFSSESMGIGFAIDPINGIVKAPFNGKVTMLFKTNHAIALQSNDGIEVLIHIGIDTVKLDGSGFKAFVQEGQLVKQGTKLIKFNLNKIKKQGYDPSVMVIITNQDENKKYQFVAETQNIEDVKINQEMVLIN